MRFTWVTLLAFVIAVSSAVFDLRGSVNFVDEQVSSAPQFQDVFDSDSLHKLTERLSKDTNVIAQDFIPIVILAELIDYSRSFAYYLPLYRLLRKKDFFLLI